MSKIESRDAASLLCGGSPASGPSRRTVASWQERRRHDRRPLATTPSFGGKAIGGEVLVYALTHDYSKVNDIEKTGAYHVRI